MIANAGMDAADPHRPVDWRARRARHLADTHRRPSRHDDFVTQELARFYGSRDVARSPGQRARRVPVNRDLACAVAIHEERDGLGRALLEARLLCRQSPTKIAVEQGISVDAVAWYAAAFYDMSDRLDRFDFIVGSVIGPLPTESHPNAIIGWCCRRAGYHLGIDELEEQVAASQHGMLRTIIKAASAVVDPNDTRGVAKLVQAQVRKQAAEGTGNAQHEILLSAVDQVLDAFEITVGGRGAMPGRLGPYDRAGIELTADEQYRLGQGEVLENVPKEMTFPPLPSSLDPNRLS